MNGSGFADTDPAAGFADTDPTAGFADTDSAAATNYAASDSADVGG